MTTDLNRCDLCQRALEPDDGGLCWACSWDLERQRNDEWWKDNPDGAA